jgi:hypothetical protein
MAREPDSHGMISISTGIQTGTGSGAGSGLPTSLPLASLTSVRVAARQDAPLRHNGQTGTGGDSVSSRRYQRSPAPSLQLDRSQGERLTHCSDQGSNPRR